MPKLYTIQEAAEEGGYLLHKQINFHMLIYFNLLKNLMTVE